MTPHRFEVGPQIGAGAVGVVYAGRQRSLDRQVAIKVLRPELADDETARLRFLDEARTCDLIGRSRRPGITEIYDIVDDLFPPAHPGGPRLPAIVMELLVGRTLRDYLAHKGALEPAEAVRILRAVLEALSHAHNWHGGAILHRDIKPANIFLCQEKSGEERVVLTDFGLARVASAAALTKTGEIVGNVDSMSPEQIESKPLDVRSDLYSCGVLLYEMLAGHPPFPGESFIAIAYAHLHTPPPPLPASVPLILRRATMRALAKKPSERFASAAEFADALSPGAKAIPWTKIGMSAAVALGLTALLWNGAMPHTVRQTNRVPIAAPPAHQAAPDVKQEIVKPGVAGVALVSSDVTYRWWQPVKNVPLKREIQTPPVAPQVRETVIMAEPIAQPAPQPADAKKRGPLQNKGQKGRRLVTYYVTFEGEKEIARERGAARVEIEAAPDIYQLRNEKPVIVNPKKVQETTKPKRARGGKKKTGGGKTSGGKTSGGKKTTGGKSSGGSSGPSEKSGGIFDQRSTGIF